MQESRRPRLSYVRSKAAELNLPEDFHSKLDIHVHCRGRHPEGRAVGGLTLATTLVSALTKIPDPPRRRDDGRDHAAW